jgi:hypothetical protein
MGTLLKTNTRWLACCALATLVATGCGDMLYVEMEVPEVCNNVGDAGFAGLDPALLAAAQDAGIELDAGVQTVAYDFAYPLAQALPGGDALSGAEGEVSLLNVTFIAESGITDFSFIEHASIVVSPPPGAALQTRTLLEYTQTPATAGQSSIVLEGQRFDLMEYVKRGALHLSMSLTGRLPLGGWSTTIRACGYVRGRYNYLNGPPQ